MGANLRNFSDFEYICTQKNKMNGIYILLTILLYFGMLLPMAAAETGGWLLPALYAVATGLPVAAAAWILAYGAAGIGVFYNRMQRLQKGLTLLVGGGMILAGIYYAILLIS